MSNIIKFHSSERPPANQLHGKARYLRAPTREQWQRVGGWARVAMKWLWLLIVLIWLILRIPLFFVMCWLRLPIALVCELISVPSLFAFLFCWYAFPVPKMLWGIGLLSFTSFALLWIYDFILMAISPFETLRSL